MFLGLTIKQWTQVCIKLDERIILMLVDDMTCNVDDRYATL
jgi:hypothetical protein